MQMLIENLTRDYFEAFSRKDTAELKRMFAEDVQLIDWDVNYTGRSLVLEFNQKLFDSVNTIKVTPRFISVTGLTSMSKILVEVDDIKLKVIDVITFDNAGKIKTVEAYKQ